MLTSFFPGDCLISSGDDGSVRFWKKALTGEWLEFAETDMTDECVLLTRQSMGFQLTYETENHLLERN
jgi:hypothetical protein